MKRWNRRPPAWACFAGLVCFMAGGYCCGGVTNPAAHGVANVILFPFRLLPVSDVWVAMLVVGAFWGGLTLLAGWGISALRTNPTV